MIDDIRIVSPLQVYLDVKGYRGRGEKAAEVFAEGCDKTKMVKRKIKKDVLNTLDYIRLLKTL